MATSNHERVGRALEQLKLGLLPFVEREMKAVHKDRWQEQVANSFPAGHPALKKKGSLEWDAAVLLSVMWNEWNDVFRNTLGHAERSYVSELREVRNRWAHQEAFSSDDTERSLDSMRRLLVAVSAAKEAEEIDRTRMELMRLRFDEQVRHEKRKSAETAIEGQPVAGLKPWREVVTPHPDVASGKYQQAEFAADLWQVYLGEGVPEYRDPTEFYRRTFLTVGLRDMLTRALVRLAGKGGDPVVELQTNFGGGKTHSMLALYHLFSGISAKELPGIEPVLQEAGVDVPKAVRRAVLVGNKLSPGQPEKKKDGTVVHTLWGEMAWQLGGKEGYAMIRKADETATNPGDNLRSLFNKYAPCLILIDEWVAYARQLHESRDLPGGDFETHFTFAQTLSEAAKAANQTMLVVSIPASGPGGGVSPDSGIEDEEVGGKRGRDALIALRNALGRVETPWRPANAEESFEIVRRRLFQPIADPKRFVDRDAVVRAFCDMYRTQHQEFPPECREGDYERKMKSAYPIHPEIFDRLYQDWSSLVKFQRTRGVLRLMASVIHCLWEREDKSVLIIPAALPLDSGRVQSEMTRYLPDGWDTVIEKDVDGEDSLPLRLDRDKPNLGRYSACRRVARTVFLGSAPTGAAANRGIEDRRIRLGCVQPGENPPVFGDALRHLAQQATYLYLDNARYWYSSQASVTKLAEDRAEQLRRSADRIAEEIKKRVREDVRSKAEFAKVHPFPASNADVPDEMETRLVVLDVDHAHGREGESAAEAEAARILENRGTSPRRFKNTLVFLAADRARLVELDSAVRSYLAWESIENDSQGERPSLNLDNFQRRQTLAQKKNADTTVAARIPETFIWLLVPMQETPQSALTWQAIRLQGQDTLAVRATKKLKNEELLLTELAGSRLRLELDRVPLWRGDHVGVAQLVEDFALYVYLPRLCGPYVVAEAVRDGVSLTTWEQDAFGYADEWVEAEARYRGLRTGRVVNVTPESTGLVVRSAVAVAQLAKERAATTGGVTGGGPVVTGGGGGTTGGTGVTGGETGGTTPDGGGEPVKSDPKRFYGSVKLDATRLNRDAGRIANEVIQHLVSQVGSSVEVTLEVSSSARSGFSPDVVRTVTENCRTLNFENSGFEAE
ncbi:MAG: DUF499 domain-containing protein [Lentisphaerae bacterium]|nr:DUF499 domain-containing protein [Lentisphaerota bacterium]